MIEEKKEEETRPQLHIKCSNCSKPLMSVMMDPSINDPATGKPFVWKLTATCPYCKDKSFPHDVRGKIYPVGYARPNSANAEDVFHETFIDEVIYGEGKDEGKIEFRIQKA
jgi:hypothetical protein